MLQKVIIASTNPTKIKATELGFKAMFPRQKFGFEEISVKSGVADQPMSSQEALRGAINRARNAKEERPYADFWVGLEGGVQTNGKDLESYSWVVVLGKNGQVGRGKSGTFVLPKKVVELIRAGKELGEADDIVFQRKDSKKSDGAVGLLTGGVIDRATLYYTPVVLSLIPFKNKDLY